MGKRRKGGSGTVRERKDGNGKGELLSDMMKKDYLKLKAFLQKLKPNV